MKWSGGKTDRLKIFDGRRYKYKGFKRGVAMEGDSSPVMNICGRDFCDCRWDLTRD